MSTPRSKNPNVSFSRLLSLRCHHHRKRHLDELFVSVDRVQGASGVVGRFAAAVMLYSV